MAPRIPGGFRAAAVLVKPPLLAVTRRVWSGAEHLPTDRGFIAVSNHASYADPFTFAHFLYDHGFAPHFLAKASLFDIPVAGRALQGLDQVPVHRGSARARDAVDAAVTLLRRGDSIAVFPEGTLTRDPELWPMVARTGAARMALENDVPVIPVAQWGAHELLPPYSKKVNLFPRKTVTVMAGPPVDLEEFRGRDLDIQVLRSATDRIMATLTSMLEEIRGEKAPAKPWDSRREGGGR
ncbi:lysophospholipid acyltransferase family protein [Demequina activiva]|uniref:1-acyl-sn-glycerol-3-phosphate acyltransferase n=1 Tax=Demequina activiva TaxID=1582364 RepID=A0A919Q6I4_9MICO|nr:lysophospholipid acyltransferase family protein [Demequina activiva]GIG55128.1 1-acyl-sn-glycerol-3-phosphate acyltransferase [Demequina activiva]